MLRGGDSATMKVFEGVSDTLKTATDAEREVVPPGMTEKVSCTYTNLIYQSRGMYITLKDVLEQGATGVPQRGWGWRGAKVRNAIID